MELERQIQQDKKTYVELTTAIDSATTRFNKTLELISELTEQLGSLRERQKDYEIRINVREQQLLSVVK